MLYCLFTPFYEGSNINSLLLKFFKKFDSKDTVGLNKRKFYSNRFIQIIRDLPGVALVITFHDTFHKREIEFLYECALSQILQHACKNIATMVKH